MVFPFSSKKTEGPSKGYVPVNLVQKYASQGMSEQEIVSILKSQGFVPGQIDAAMRSVLRERVSEPQRRPEAAVKEQFPSMEMGPKETAGPAPLPPRREPEMQMPQQQEPEPEQEEASPVKFTFEETESSHPMEEVTLEEVIEGIVAEKWQDFEGRLANFEERDLQLQQQIQDLRRSMKEVEKMMERKEQDLSGRFEEFGGSVAEIQGRIGSIEKVFKEFIPELSRSMKSISESAERK